MKIITKLADYYDMTCFEECLSEEGIELGFFPDELENYSLKDFVKDWFITLLHDYDSIIKSVYFQYNGTDDKIIITYKNLEEDDLDYYKIIIKITKQFKYCMEIKTKIWSD